MCRNVHISYIIVGTDLLTSGLGGPASHCWLLKQGVLVGEYPLIVPWFDVPLHLIFRFNYLNQ